VTDLNVTDDTITIIENLALHRLRLT
jgi:hypothetical protein